MSLQLNQLIIIDTPEETLNHNEWPFQVFITSDEPLPNEEIYGASIGAIPIELITVDIFNSNFSGFIATIPNTGDRLKIDFDIQGQVETNLTYDSGTIV